MKILAIETSSERASAALLIDDCVIEFDLEGHANHSLKLLSTIDSLLAQGGITPTSLDAVAFGAGPGAFTGLRLACGVAQGLAMGAGLGVVAVPSLAALASQARAPRVFSLTDARMGEIYTAAYGFSDGEPVELTSACCMRPEDFRLPPEGAWHLIGSALRAYPEIVTGLDQERIVAIHADAAPRACDIARLGVIRVSRGEAVAPELAVPLYVRDKVALTTAERLARGGRV